MKKKTLAILVAIVMLISSMPLKAMTKLDTSSSIAEGSIFDELESLAQISYSHNEDYTGNDGEEFIEDGDGVIKSNSSGMSSSTVTIRIEFNEDVTSMLLSFEYKVSSESRYDYLSINDSTDKSLSGEVDWTVYTQDITAGSVVTLSYKKDFSGDRGDDCVWFKNFTVCTLNTVTFTGLDDEAELSVTNSVGEIEQPTADRNVYRLTDGEYDYSVIRFGYSTISGHIEVSDDIEIALEAMAELSRCEIAFNVTPNEATVTVTHTLGGTFESSDNSFSLPIGETYTYTVQAENYITTTGSFTASEGLSIEIGLVYAGEAWDGTSVTEPEIDGNNYLISNAAEFEWFAQYINAGNNEVNAILTSNINFNNKARTAFGIYNYSDEQSRYNGTIDGKGYTIIGITGENGLADCIGPNGVIKNLTVDVNIANSANIGGIANTSKGLVENCLCMGQVSTSSNYCSSAGIVGRAMTGNTVRGCVNRASISNTTNSYASTLSLGGIVGYTYGTVENCYNAGELSTKVDRPTNKGIGGIAGQAQATATIINVYNIATVTGPEAGIGGIVGIAKGMVSNAYCLVGTAPNAIATTNDGASVEYEVMTREQMLNTSFVSALGESFCADYSNINSGFPVLTWQSGTEDQPSDMELALEHYPELIRDFVNKDQAVDMNALINDIQLPTPGDLVNAGIMTDRPNQKVIMESLNEEVFELYGYHGIVYRALPEGEAVTVQYRISIQDRNTEEILASRVFELTVLPLTELELEQAETEMAGACNEELYWNGIKGDNTDKDNVTSDLRPFAELVIGSDGEYEYIRGAINITFGGIEVDDLPGYNPMGFQPWRTFRSSNNSIISCENLLVTRPEYDTEVTIDSVLSYTKYAKYWEKFGTDSAYARFEQFYKQPVSVTVTVKGTLGSAPIEDITATVIINGRNFNGFTNPVNEYLFTCAGNSGASVWDAILECLTPNGFGYTGDGHQLISLTDKNGIILSGDGYGEASGWFYSLNGSIDVPAMGNQVLSNGDVIELFFTDDIESEGTVTLLGDANGDGSVTSSDAVLILRCALGIEPITAKALANGDIDGDGILSISDSLFVLRMSMGINEQVSVK